MSRRSVVTMSVVAWMVPTGRPVTGFSSWCVSRTVNGRACARVSADSAMGPALGTVTGAVTTCPSKDRRADWSTPWSGPERPGIL
ncbi:hypothetical protein RB200_24160 [Streptomyces sp. PmtG]